MPKKLTAKEEAERAEKKRIKNRENQRKRRARMTEEEKKKENAKYEKTRKRNANKKKQSPRPPIEDEDAQDEVEIIKEPVRHKDNAEKCRAYAERKREEIGKEEFLKHQRERKAKWRKRTGKN
jgi:hypothetical protein